MNTGQGNKTWDEFYQDAKKIHTLGDNYYITSDTGGAGFYDSMTWLASATPFSTEGETVTINLTGDPKIKARGFFGDYLWQVLHRQPEAERWRRRFGNRL